MLRHRLHSLEIPLGGDWKPRLDHVDIQLGELGCHAEFLLDIHAESRRLLAISQRGIEDPNFLAHHALLALRGVLVSTPNQHATQRPKKKLSSLPRQGRELHSRGTTLVQRIHEPAMPQPQET
jgi:hypothetical protein